MTGYIWDGARVHTGDGLRYVKVGRPVTPARKSDIMTFQVDGEELEAVLWGLANYKKACPHCGL